MRKPAHETLAAAMALMFACSGCSEANRPVRQSWLAMSTYASLSVPAADRRNLREYARICEAVMADVERTLSVFDPESEISRINSTQVGTAVTVSRATAELLRLASDYWAISEGGFDPTVGPLMRLWGFRNKEAPADEPSESEIKAILERVGFHNVSVADNEVSLGAKGIQIDLGGIAKGFAVDLCHDRLAADGARHVLVNLGGNMRAIGQAGQGRRGKGRPWLVGVRNPFDPARTIGSLSLADGEAVATSGNYERFVPIGTNLYSHIVDPRSGRPVKGMAGVTILAPNAAMADAMSTAVFVAGIDGAAELLARVERCEALLVPDRQPLEIWMTPGFADVFSPSESLDTNVLNLLRLPDRVVVAAGDRDNGKEDP